MTDTTTSTTAAGAGAPPAAAPTATPAAAPAPAAAPTPAPVADAKPTDLLAESLAAGEKAAPADAKAPEGELEVKVPEGFTVDDGALKTFKESAKKLGLDSAKAQAVLEGYVALDKQRAQADEAAFQKQAAEWAKQVLSDPEVGGDKLPAAKVDVKRALDKFGGKELVGLLQQAGLSSHPVVFKTLAAIGRALKEDSVAGTAVAPKAPKKSDAELFGFTT